jgi:hypothetical protein
LSRQRENEKGPVTHLISRQSGQDITHFRQRRAGAQRR